MSPICWQPLPMVSQPEHYLPRPPLPMRPIQQEHRPAARVLERTSQPDQDGCQQPTPRVRTARVQACVLRLPQARENPGSSNAWPVTGPATFGRRAGASSAVPANARARGERADSAAEPLSGLRVKNPKFPAIVLAERLANLCFVKVSQLR